MFTRSFRKIFKKSSVGLGRLHNGARFARSFGQQRQHYQHKPQFTSPRSRFGWTPMLAGVATLSTASLMLWMGSEDTTLCTAYAQQPRFSNMSVFAGNSNPKLAAAVAKQLGVDLGYMNVKRFNDGEIGIRVKENIRGKDIYLIQPTCPPNINDHVMELLLMISTMRRASAGKITAVIPYYGYARQDRKLKSRVPISAADMARLLEAMGVDRVVAVDLHCGQIQGFFSPEVPVDNLEGHYVGLDYFAQLGLDPANTKVVSPDAGGVFRAKQFQQGLRFKGLNAGLAMIIKQRQEAGVVGSMDLVGDIDGCDVIIVDDMIDTAGTLTKAASELRKKGAKRIFAFASHGLFSGPAYERIGDSCIEKVVVTNSIPLKEGSPDNILQLDIAPLIAESIARIHLQKSISALFLHKK